MILPVIGAIAGVVSTVGGIMARNSQRAANRAAAQAAADRANRVAQQTYRQQVKTVHQNYLNSVREREWNHYQALGGFLLDETSKRAGLRLQESRSEFQFAASEIGRKLQHDLDALSLEREEFQRRDRYERDALAYESSEIGREDQFNQRNYQRARSEIQREAQALQQQYEAKQRFASYEQGAARHNFNVDMQYLLGQQNKALNELEIYQQERLEKIENDSLDTIAIQRYNIAVGEVGARVALAQIEGNKAITASQKKALKAGGARLALGQTGNTVARLLVDIVSDQKRQEEEVLGAMGAAAGQGQVDIAIAKLKLATALRRERRVTPRVLAGAVMGVRMKSFLDDQWDPKKSGELAETGVVREPGEEPRFDPASLNRIDATTRATELDFSKAILPPKFRRGPGLPTFVKGPDFYDFVKGPQMYDYIERQPQVYARYIPGVAPVRGPEVPEPMYPEEPIPVTAESIGGGGGGGGGFFDALGGILDIGSMAWRNFGSTPAASAAPTPTFSYTPYSGPGHPMTQPYGQRYLP